VHQVGNQYIDTNMTLLWDVIHDFTARNFLMLLKSKYRSYKVVPVLNYAI